MLQRSYALAQPGFLVQTVRTPAVLVHCHWLVKTALTNGFGRVSPIDRNAAAQASATMAATSAISLVVHVLQVIAFTPIPVRRE
jgi:hypothetical protein